MSRRGFVAGTTALLAAAALGRVPAIGVRRARGGPALLLQLGRLREPEDLPGVHEGDGNQGQEGLLHLERGAVREAQGRRPRLRPRGADRLHGADPRGREAPPADRLVEASDRGARRSTRSSASCRSTPRTRTRWRRTGARPGSCTASDLVKERPDDLASVRQPREDEVLGQGHRARRHPRVRRLDARDARLLVQQRQPEGARRGEEGARRAQAPPPLDHVDAVQAAADLGQGRDGARLERRRARGGGAQAGQLRGRQGGR